MSSKKLIFLIYNRLKLYLYRLIFNVIVSFSNLLVEPYIWKKEKEKQWQWCNKMLRNASACGHKNKKFGICLKKPWFTQFLEHWQGVVKECTWRSTLWETKNNLLNVHVKPKFTYRTYWKILKNQRKRKAEYLSLMYLNVL